MGLFSWLFGASTKADGKPTFLAGTGNYDFEIVGEASYQKALGVITGGKTEDGVEHECWAEIVPEPTNRHDKNAVQVRIDGHCVGYIQRDLCSDYHAGMKRLGRRGDAMVCRALIVGGWKRGRHDTGHFGVRLDLDWPPQLEESAP